MSNQIDEKSFEKISDHALETLADKLINTTNKEENQIIIKNINKNKDKLYETDPFGDFVIQSDNLCGDLKYILILFWILMKNAIKSDLKI